VVIVLGGASGALLAGLAICAWVIGASGMSILVRYAFGG
jgi:hypothetical protein